MRSVQLRWAAAVTLCSVMAAAAMAEDVAAVQKQIGEKYKALKSFRAKMTQKTEMGTPQFKMQSHSTGTYECVNKSANVAMYRMETQGKNTNEMAGQKTENKVDSLTIGDGTYVYNLNDMDGQKSATKMKQPQTGPVEFDVEMFKDWDLKLLPEEKIDGAACWVIEMTPKAGTPQASAGGKTVNWFRQDCGWPAKTISYNAEGQAVTTLEYKDMEIDPKIDESRFVFKAPPGVQVTEM